MILLSEKVSRETIVERKEIFKNLLFSWNKKTNLVQEDSLLDFENRHWKDSFQLIDYLNLDNGSILDLGSGSGFPGIVLGIYGYDVTLTEVIQKKIFFLREVIRLCSLNNVTIINDANSITSKFDIVTSRAFSELKNILKIQEKVSRETTRGIFLKGKNYEKEINESSNFFDFNHRVCASKTSKDGVIIEISNLKKK